MAGLLDTRIDATLCDLAGADLTVRDFTSPAAENAWLAEHGTYSVAVLVGQGRLQIRGIAPRARLFVASVVDAAGIAAPRAVIDAMDWLLSAGVGLIIIPLGEPVERAEIAQRIERSAAAEVAVFAAAGNGHPEPVVFPAQNRMAIAVGAADSGGVLLPDCSRLPRLDLIAPGWRIPAPIRGRVVRRRSGSSVACVAAAGVAMLAWSAGAMATASRRNVLATLTRRSAMT